MNKYFVLKLKDGSIIALSHYHYKSFNLEWVAAAAIEANSEAEAGVKFALQYLLDRQALASLLSDYLESKDWRTIGDVSAEQLENLDSLLETSVFEGLEKQKQEFWTEWK